MRRAESRREEIVGRQLEILEAMMERVLQGVSSGKVANVPEEFCGTRFSGLIERRGIGEERAF